MNVLYDLGLSLQERGRTGSATQHSEIFGAETDLVFVQEDIGKRV